MTCPKFEQLLATYDEHMSTEITHVDVASAFRVALALGGVNGLVVLAYNFVAQSYGGLEISLSR